MKTLLRITLALAAGMAFSAANAQSFELTWAYRYIDYGGYYGDNSPSSSAVPGPFTDHIYAEEYENSAGPGVHVWQESDIDPMSGSMSGQSGFLLSADHLLKGFDSSSMSASSMFSAEFSLASAAQYTLSVDYDATVISLDPSNDTYGSINMAFYKIPEDDGPLTELFAPNLQIFESENGSFSSSGMLDPGDYAFMIQVGFYTYRRDSISSPTPWGGGGLTYDFQFNVTPVPEPGTWALLLAGLGLMGFVARRRSVA